MSYTNGLDNPELYFQTKLYTGNNSTNAITLDGSENMQPDLVWVKKRNASADHILFDSVRGVQKGLFSSRQTEQESEGGTRGLNAFNTDGFTLGAEVSDMAGSCNDNNDTFCSWNWKAGTSVSGTTTGSGTSKAYTGSVSTDAVFSIIKYIGNGTAGHQIPHHLNAVPKMIILKNITGGDENWFVYHASLGNTKDIHLNTTGASATADSWNDTTPTSTVWTMSDQSAINSTDGNDHIAYCFAQKKGYSKFGSYKGNGNDNGTFVYTGFKPAFTILKKSSGTDNWVLHDNKRSDVPNANVNDQVVYPNSNASELSSSTRAIDTVSNGFKCRGSGGNINASGETYIYMAFAEAPFVTSTGIPTTAR